MILDTGSDEIVIKSNRCAGCSGFGYDHDKSSTYKIDTDGPNDGQEFFEYGSGAVRVQRFFDVIHSGPIKGTDAPLTEMISTDISFMHGVDPKTDIQAIV